MRVLRRAAALAILAAATPVQAAPLDCAPGKPCSVDLTAEQMFELAETYEGRGQHGAAAALLEALTADTRSEIRTEAYFRLGKLRHRMAEYARAVAAFEAALALAPDAQPIRLEMARSLAAMGDNAAAARQLRKAQSAGLPEDVARAVDRISTALLGERCFGGSFEFGLAPDSNINRATSANTIEIGGLPLQLDEDARSRSGVGATFAGQAYWRPSIAEDAAWLSRLSVGANLYGDSDFNDITAALTTGPEWHGDFGRLTLAASASRRWFGGERYADRYGPTFEWLAPLTRTSQANVRLSVLKQRYQQNALQDGTEYAGEIRLEKALSPRLYGRASLSGSRATAKDDAYALKSLGGDLLLSRDFGRLTVFAGGGYRWTRGDGVFLLFGDRRRDDRIDLNAGVALRSLSVAGLAPVVRLTHTDNKSSLTLYDFRQTRVEFALSREF